MSAPPLCLACEKQPATPDAKPNMRRLIWRALREGETEEQQKAREQRLASAPRRFCDNCRKVMERARCSDDEMLALFHLAVAGIDPVTVLWSELQSFKKRLKRRGLIFPGLTVRMRKAFERDAADQAVVRGAKDQTAAQEARRTGKTPAAIRMRRYRARKKLQPKP
jgi:hypothetical protein